MRIRTKIIAVVLPVLIGALLVAEADSYTAAANGISRITQRLFNGTINDLRTYIDAPPDEDGYTAAQSGLEIYARSLVLRDTELIFAVDPSGTLTMATAPLELLPEEIGPLMTALQENQERIMPGAIGGKERLFQGFYWSPFDWYIVASEERAACYQDVNRLILRGLAVIGGSAALMTVILLLFARFLTKSLRTIGQTMQSVITGGDLSARTEVTYRDETGNLAHIFNLMIGTWEKSARVMKQYAFNAAVSHKKELQIRQIFQKYAPKEQIDVFFGAPEPALAGGRREIAVLFADIRGFAAIAEKTAPQEAVDGLNRYFSVLVETIIRRNGMIDKFIGEALRAFWGAPVTREDDPMQAVLAGLDLLDSIKKFNDRQRIKGKPEFTSGIGVSYGPAIVGNIGSGQKMEYTILGDTAGLAAQLGGLTGLYKEALLISEPLYTEIKNKEPKLPIRLLDTAAVAGKAQGVKVYTVKRSVTVPEAKAWGYYHEGMSLYYRRSFEEAVQQFRKALIILHDDPAAEILLARSLAYEEHPPPPEWNGAAVSI